MLRDAAAGLARAAGKRTDLATSLAEIEVPGVSRTAVAQAVAEGCVLGTYRFNAFKSEPKDGAARAGRADGAGGGAQPRWRPARRVARRSPRASRSLVTWPTPRPPT